MRSPIRAILQRGVRNIVQSDTATLTPAPPPTPNGNGYASILGLAWGPDGLATGDIRAATGRLLMRDDMHLARPIRIAIAP